jgi:predicted AlkP superfamily pyrophosphatase or phosphodiesterase
MRRRMWAGLLAALALAGVAGAKPINPNAPKKPAPQGTQKPKGGPAAPRLSRRVVVVSLDGAGAEDLQQLWRDDLLDEGGFARFFREGEVAAALVPVDPTLTAPNHASLATGAAPDHTGIVGNHFHAADAAPFEKASGFGVPIGAETLWEAARRQKRRAAVLAWPGADDTGPRRRGELGMTYLGAPDRDPQLLVLKRSDWRPAGPPPKLASRSPVLTARVTLGGPGGADPAAIDLFAVDRTNDGREDYDGLVAVASSTSPGPGVAGGQADVANLRQSEPLGQGQWAELRLADRSGSSACWVKVLALDPGLEAVRVYVGGSYRLHAYPPELARDLEETNLFWPGRPDDLRLAAGWRGKPGIDLQTWIEQAQRFAAFFGGAMRVAAARDDWDLMLGYIPVIDEAGHALLLADPHQAGWSAARRDELTRARRKVWQAVDHELRLLLAALDLGRTTVVVVSDHGMAPVHTAVDLNALLRERGLLASPPGGAAGGGGAAYAIGDGGTAHLYLAGAGPPSDAAARQRLLAGLRDQLLAWRAGDDLPIERVLTRQEAAELGLDHPNSGDLILFAREGYSFDPGPQPSGAAVTHPAPLYGTHGYLAANSNMRGIYLAIGKDVKPATTTGPVQALDVAGRVAAWLGMEKPRPAAPGGPGGTGGAGGASSSANR